MQLFGAMPQNTIVTTKNPDKVNTLTTLVNASNQHSEYIMSLTHIERMLPWSASGAITAPQIAEIVSAMNDLDRFAEDEKSIRAADEDHPTARQNALQKLQSYLDIFIQASKQDHSLAPAFLIAEDSDFTFGQNVPDEVVRLKTPGAIKLLGEIEGHRNPTPKEVAQYYGALVEKYGWTFELSHLGFSEPVLGLPVDFNFAYAVAIRSTAEGHTPVHYNCFTMNTVISGYLLPFDESKFNPKSPMIWLPDNKGLRGLTMPELMKISESDNRIITRIFPDAVKGLQDITTGNNSGWNKEE
jgi:hypothetical protein